MEILEDKVIAKYLFEKYCTNPKNWNFVISRSGLSDGFFDATVSNTDEVWQTQDRFNLQTSSDDDWDEGRI